MNEQEQFDLVRRSRRASIEEWIWWALVMFAIYLLLAGICIGCGDAPGDMYLIREEVDYPWKRCVYQDIVSEYVYTIKASQACPQWISPNT
jgi:hypothetical protein